MPVPTRILKLTRREHSTTRGEIVYDSKDGNAALFWVETEFRAAFGSPPQSLQIIVGQDVDSDA